MAPLVKDTTKSGLDGVARYVGHLQLKLPLTVDMEPLTTPIVLVRCQTSDPENWTACHYVALIMQAELAVQRFAYLRFI